MGSWLDRPCPDCGSKTTSRKETYDNVEWAIVYCPACDSLLEMTPDTQETVVLAMALDLQKG